MTDHDTLTPLNKLEEKIKTARKQLVASSSEGSPSPASHGMRAGLDLVSGVAVGTATGYAADRYCNTLPLFMLIGLALGTAAGVKLMMETSRRVSAALEKEESERE